MNKSIKRVLALVLALVMVFALCACGSSSTSSSGTSSTASNGKFGGYDSTLYKVLQTKKITVGVIGAFAPCSYKDANGEWQGFEVEVAKKIADSLGAEISFVEVTSDSRISSIETGKVDICMGNSTRTLERCQKVAFSDTLIVSSERLLVASDSTIDGIKSIPAGSKVGVTKGGTMDQEIQAIRTDLEIVYYTSPTDGVVAVKNGQCVAFAEDSNTLQYCRLSDTERYILRIVYFAAAILKKPSDRILRIYMCRGRAWCAWKTPWEEARLYRLSLWRKHIRPRKNMGLPYILTAQEYLTPPPP